MAYYPLNRPLFSTPSFACTYGSASNQGPTAQYGIGASIGLAFSEIAQANANKAAANNYAMASGNHWHLSNGTHAYGDGGKIIKSDTCIRYEPANGMCTGWTSDGIPYSYMK